MEVSAVAAALIQDIVRRLITSSGSCLIIDYGENGASGDSLRGIKNHEFVNPLHDPGKVNPSNIKVYATYLLSGRFVC